MGRRCAFDAYLMVDWSANSTPKTGKDSIWLCLLERNGRVLRRRGPENPPTRTEARERIAEMLSGLVARRRVTLVGFDFPFGYPAGLARRLGLQGRPWRALWDEIARSIEDGAYNQNNRFDVAAAFNRRLTGEAFPFWGCPPKTRRPWLSPRRPRPHTPAALRERRLTELRARTAQPVWKLAYPGAAGSQALLGIPVVRTLRDRLRAVSRVWPFETGLEPSREGGCKIVYVEVYPSLVPVWVAPGQVKDAIQVERLGRHFSELDDTGGLTHLFAGPADLSAEDRRVVETEEGWILGVR